jgi:hypothetical protein
MAGLGGGGDRRVEAAREDAPRGESHLDRDFHAENLEDLEVACSEGGRPGFEEGSETSRIDLVGVVGGIEGAGGGEGGEPCLYGPRKPVLWAA